MRPGFGTRHPALLELLATVRPAFAGEDAWGGGETPLRIAAYDRPAALPDELITSARCVVLVGEAAVICRNADGILHALPGGRREPGETLAGTAAREVGEETGWLIDPATLEELGWLHYQHLAPRPEGNPYSRYPWPDFLQVVFGARASERLGGVDGEWTDTEGYERSSFTAPVAEAIRLVHREPWSVVFLEAATRASHL